MTQQRRFLLFSLSDRDYAIPAERVAELTVPLAVHTFPHTSHGILGIILRRGRIVPLYDVEGMLQSRACETGNIEPPAPARAASARYQIIAMRQFAETTELAAFPVSGGCDLAGVEMSSARTRQDGVSAGEKTPTDAIAGEVRWQGKTYEVLELDKLIFGESER